MSKQKTQRARGAAEQQPEAEGSDYLNMRLSEEDRARLKRIIGRMLNAKDLKRGERFSYAGAARYAFRRCLESMEASG